MKLILIFSMALIVGFCTYRVFSVNEDKQVQLSDYAIELQKLAASKKEVGNNAVDSPANAAYEGTDSSSALLQNKSSLTNTSKSLLQPSDHASGNVIGETSDHASNLMSPENETLQDDSGLDAMQVQVSQAPAPEADYIVSESISKLPIPSEEPLQDKSKTDMH
ncbi:hypothetical protein [Alteromonas sp. BMJM2]|uniref:hypothetical protein n=1 Tax=Alteromonas sp. BMJM2 TaxID=2954241 RepID=UPI0022B3F430|nr:hypothetical protein [Alteromonas sp. BMJM2]